MKNKGEMGVLAVVIGFFLIIIILGNLGSGGRRQINMQSLPVTGSSGQQVVKPEQVEEETVPMSVRYTVDGIMGCGLMAGLWMIFRTKVKIVYLAAVVAVLIVCLDFLLKYYLLVSKT
jgi:hypothetical protein